MQKLMVFIIGVWSVAAVPQHLPTSSASFPAPSSLFTSIKWDYKGLSMVRSEGIRGAWNAFTSKLSEKPALLEERVEVGSEKEKINHGGVPAIPETTEALISYDMEEISAKSIETCRKTGGRTAAAEATTDMSTSTDLIFMARTKAPRTAGKKTSATFATIQITGTNIVTSATNSPIHSTTPSSAKTTISSGSLAETSNFGKASVAATTVMIIAVSAAIIFLGVVYFKRIRRYWIRRKNERRNDPGIRLLNRSTGSTANPPSEEQGKETIMLNKPYSSSAAFLAEGSDNENPASQPCYEDGGPPAFLEERTEDDATFNIDYDQNVPAAEGPVASEQPVSPGENDVSHPPNDLKRSKTVTQQHSNQPWDNEFMLSRIRSEGANRGEMLPEIRPSMSPILGPNETW